ncbi:thermonuclease family protein [Halanaerobaculum tunisiense]
MVDNRLIIQSLILAGTVSLLKKDNNQRNNKVDQARVIKVIDGDTVYVESLAGKKEEVRLIGIDAPETDEPYGREATNYIKSQLLDKKVYLEQDISNRDGYGRLLRYIWLRPPQQVPEEEIRSKMINVILLLRGYTQVATYPPDTKYAKLFKRCEQEAKEKNKGFWGEEKEEGIRLIDLTRTVRCGNYAKITIAGSPGVEYHIEVYYKSGASTAAGLKPKVAAENSRVNWEWKVGCKTKQGTYPIIITGGDDRLEVEFSVI